MISHLAQDMLNISITPLPLLSPPPLSLSRMCDPVGPSLDAFSPRTDAAGLGELGDGLLSSTRPSTRHNDTRLHTVDVVGKMEWGTYRYADKRCFLL